MGARFRGTSQRFARYELLEYLGSGAMSDVYLALHSGLGKRVALKMLRSQLVHDHDAAERFAREGRWAARVNHPNIVDVTDVGTHEGVPFLVMELLEGETLDDKLTREGPLPLADALDILLPIMDGVSAIHAVGVIHRDIKPANVLLAVGPDGRILPKLVDFGIATGHERRHITGSLGPIGTPHYMSPEQAEGRRRLDEKSDQYSLASMLFECLTGREPFGAGDVNTVLARVREGKFPELRGHDVALPAELDPILRKAAELDPSRRYDSVDDFARALLPFASRRMRGLWQSRDLRASSHPPLRPLRSSLTEKGGAAGATIRTLRETPRPRALTLVIGAVALLLGLLLGTVGPTLGGAAPSTVARAHFRAPQAALALRTPRPAPLLAVTPATAQVWLDGQLIGRSGELAVLPLSHGALQELRVTAKGYVTRVLLFHGACPETHIALEPVAPTVVALDEAPRRR